MKLSATTDSIRSKTRAQTEISPFRIVSRECVESLLSIHSGSFCSRESLISRLLVSRLCHVLAAAVGDTNIDHYFINDAVICMAAAPLLSLRRELAKVLRCCHRFRLDIVMTKTDAREQAVRTAFSEKDSQSRTHFWARRVHFLL